MAYSSEAAKVRDMPHVMKYVVGSIIDLGCGPDKITPESFGVDGRDLPGVDYITDNMIDDIASPLAIRVGKVDTVFSSHFLEHLRDHFIPERFFDPTKDIIPIHKPLPKIIQKWAEDRYPDIKKPEF